MHSLDRDLLVLSVALSQSHDDLAGWPLGRRNRALLQMHASCFGKRLQGWCACPGCEEKVEFDLDAHVLIAAQPEALELETVAVGVERFRLPTSRDVAQAIAAGDGDSPALRLIDRCRVGGTDSPVFSAESLEEIEEALASADPMAEVRIALACPSCMRQWEDTLDIGSFVWAEIEIRARRLLWEVHSLASAYGWSEAETLALTQPRRAMYLEMVGGA